MGVGRFTSGQGPRPPHPFKKLRLAPEAGFTVCRRDNCAAPASNWTTIYGLPVTILTELTRLCDISGFLRQVAYLPIEGIAVNLRVPYQCLRFSWVPAIFSLSSTLPPGAGCDVISSPTSHNRRGLVWFGRRRVLVSGYGKSCPCPCHDCI